MAGHAPSSPPAICRERSTIELDDSFASYVGWFVPFGAAVVLVLPEPLDEAQRRGDRPAVPDRVRPGRRRARRRHRGMGGDPAVRSRATRRRRSRRSTTRPSPAATATPRRPRPARVARGRRRAGRDPDPPRRPGRPAGLDPARRAGDRDVQVGSTRGIAASLLDAAGVDVRLIARGGAPDWPGTKAARPTPVGRRLTTPAVDRSEDHARRLDAADPLGRLPRPIPAAHRRRRHARSVYLAGQSLGAQPVDGAGRRRSRARRVGAPRRRWLVRPGRAPGSTPTTPCANRPPGSSARGPTRSRRSTR